MLRIITTAISLSLVAAPVTSQSLQSMELANNLGTVLGSERRCNLSFNQDAIEDWIDAHVDPSDMGFASTLSMMVAGAEFQVQSMSESTLTAHCRSVARTARHFGFIQ